MVVSNCTKDSAPLASAESKWKTCVRNACEAFWLRATCVQDPGCMQVSAGGLQLLLALPALVKLNAWAILDDLDGVNLDSWQQQEKDTLMARLQQLQAAFRSSGRTIICSDEAKNVF
jgi:hypothetical protein